MEPCARPNAEVASATRTRRRGREDDADPRTRGDGPGCADRAALLDEPRVKVLNDRQFPAVEPWDRHRPRRSTRGATRDTRRACRRRTTRRGAGLEGVGMERLGWNVWYSLARLSRRLGCRKLARAAGLRNTAGRSRIGPGGDRAAGCRVPSPRPRPVTVRKRLGVQGGVPHPGGKHPDLGAATSVGATPASSHVLPRRGRQVRLRLTSRRFRERRGADRARRRTRARTSRCRAAPSTPLRRGFAPRL